MWWPLMGATDVKLIILYSTGLYSFYGHYYYLIFILATLNCIWVFGLHNLV